MVIGWFDFDDWPKVIYFSLALHDRHVHAHFFVSLPIVSSIQILAIAHKFKSPTVSLLESAT